MKGFTSAFYGRDVVSLSLTINEANRRN